MWPYMNFTVAFDTEFDSWILYHYLRLVYFTFFTEFWLAWRESFSEIIFLKSSFLHINLSFLTNLSVGQTDL